MTTITVGIRVSVDPSKAEAVLFALKDAAGAVLGAELLDGSVLSETVATNDAGEKVKTSKMDYVSHAPVSDLDEDDIGF